MIFLSRVRKFFAGEQIITESLKHYPLTAECAYYPCRRIGIMTGMTFLAGRYYCNAVHAIDDLAIRPERSSR